METPHILIVDDEANVRFILERTLSHAGYVLDTAETGQEAIEKLGNSQYDLVLLDLNMKPVGGIQVLNAIRARDAEITVIILTAHSTIDSAVEALRLGAFDYLYKPATPEAIRQRVRDGIQHRQQNLHRLRLLNQIEDLRQSLINLDIENETIGQAASPQRFIRAGKLVIDKYHRSATLNGTLLDLTTAEFDLLACLAEVAPVPVSPKKLVMAALNYDISETEAREIIKYHVHQLRQKIEKDSANPKYIKTVRYKGYFWSGG
ncbi:MAG TPA: response regulator transcription factor [Anaerolineales bacterium]|nr:response regulator transcription factor [Anaerolineales bacterium]